MRRLLWLPQAIAIAMLLWALVPTNPYSYYVLLRIVCCTCFVYLAVQAHRRNTEAWQWAFAVLAVVYNPVLRIHMTREFWEPVNVVSIILTAVSIRKLR